MSDPVLAFQGRIARADLAALLDATGTPTQLSPRALFGAPSLLAPEVSTTFADAARVLLSPRTNLTLRLWGGEEAATEMNVLFPDLPSGGHGVVLNPVEQEFRVAGFVDPEQILALLGPMIPPEPATAPAIFEARLDPTTMAVLAACLDLLCQDVLQARVARVLDERPMPGSLLEDAGCLARDRIKAYLQGWWGVSRFDQLITYVLPLSGLAKCPSDGDIDVALAHLAKGGLLDVSRQERLSATAALEPMLRILLGASSGFQWQRISQMVGGDALLVVERLFVLGAGGVAFDLSPTPEGLVRLALCTRAAIVDFVTEELSTLVDPVRPEIEVPPAAPAPEGDTRPPVVARFCGQCGAALTPGGKFCGNCGAPSAALRT